MTTLPALQIGLSALRGDKFRFDVYKLSDYTDELAKSHSQNGGTPEYYNKLVKKVIDEKYLDLS